jgi:hypothetical protein
VRAYVPRVTESSPGFQIEASFTTGSAQRDHLCAAPLCERANNEEEQMIKLGTGALLHGVAFIAVVGVVGAAFAAPIVRRGPPFPPPQLGPSCPAGFAMKTWGSPPSGPNSGYTCTQTVTCMPPANGAIMGAGGVVNQVNGGATFILNCRYSAPPQ